MMHFTLKKISKANRDKLYSVSIDVENFSNLMPKYFKSLIIKKSIGNEIFVDEKIHFLGSFDLNFHDTETVSSGFLIFVISKKLYVSVVMHQYFCVCVLFVSLLLISATV